MTWVRMDDQYYRHPKVRKLLTYKWGPSALVLNQMAWCFCAEALTDGVVEKHDLRVIVPFHPPHLTPMVDLLVEVGLWKTLEPGKRWQINDYLDYNPSKVEVMLTREKDKYRQRRKRGVSRRDNVRDIR